MVSTERKVQVGFTVALALLCVIGAISYHAVASLRQSMVAVAHTHEVLAVLGRVSSEVTQAVSAERGYAVMGRAADLERHAEAVRRAGSHIQALLQLTADNPVQQRRIELLRQVVDERIRFTTEVNALKRDGGLEAVRAALLSGKGDALDARIRTAIDGMSDAERALLRQREEAAARDETVTKAVVVAGGALAFLTAALALLFITRDMARKRREEAGLHEAVGRLESRVSEQVDQIDHVSASLEASNARLRGIIRSAMDAIVTIDETQRIVLFNAAAEKTFLCPVAEAVGSPLDRFIPERFRSAHGRHVEAFGHTGITDRAMGRQQLYGLRADGEEFPIDASISQVTVEGRKFYTVILRDVTRRIRAEDQVRRSLQELREMSATMHAVREAERTRIARELHDELAQWLTALKMDVSWLASRLPAGSDALRARTDKMKGLVDSTVASVRRIAADLRPVMLDDLGLMPSVQSLLQQLTERTGIAASLDLGGQEPEFGEPIATGAYRMVQEALTNVARHSQASEARVALRVQDGTLAIRISDNGVGLGAVGPERKSFGLLGIRERAQTLGGSARIYSPDAGGTVVEISIPLARYFATEAQR